MNKQKEISLREKEILKIKENAILEKESRLNNKLFFRSHSKMNIYFLLSLFLVATVLLSVPFTSSVSSHETNFLNLSLLLSSLIFYCFLGFICHVQNENIENYFTPNSIIKIKTIHLGVDSISASTELKSLAELSLEMKTNFISDYENISNLINNKIVHKKHTSYSFFITDENGKRLFYESENRSTLYTKKEVERILELEKEIGILKASE